VPAAPKHLACEFIKNPAACPSTTNT